MSQHFKYKSKKLSKIHSILYTVWELPVKDCVITCSIATSSGLNKVSKSLNGLNIVRKLLLGQMGTGANENWDKWALTFTAIGEMGTWGNKHEGKDNIQCLG